MIQNFNVKINEFCIISIGAHTPSEAISIVKERYAPLIKESNIDPDTICIEYERHLKPNER